MTQRCRHNRRNRLLMVLTTIMALLFVQVLPLHVHAPLFHHPPTASSAVAQEHEHTLEIHLAALTHDDAEHGPATEIDTAATVVVKNLKFGDLLAAVLLLTLVLLISPFVSGHRRRYDLNVAVITRSALLWPPLRAPPL
ncbi:MAG: hypothetical protein FD130_1683 [Halothiobacillaceae bacterium]|nr:MAG: hypothetical protein FD130_1683 [Halothiobacillaceae bacterium]